MDFIKGAFEEDKKYILKNYIKHIGIDKCYALVCKEHSKNNINNNFHFYARNYYDTYYDWTQYKIINFSKMNRKLKLEKIKSL